MHTHVTDWLGMVFQVAVILVCSCLIACGVTPSSSGGDQARASQGGQSQARASASAEGTGAYEGVDLSRPGDGLPLPTGSKFYINREKIERQELGLDQASKSIQSVLEPVLAPFPKSILYEAIALRDKAGLGMHFVARDRPGGGKVGIVINGESGKRPLAVNVYHSAPGKAQNSPGYWRHVLSCVGASDVTDSRPFGFDGIALIDWPNKKSASFSMSKAGDWSVTTHRLGVPPKVATAPSTPTVPGASKPKPAVKTDPPRPQVKADEEIAMPLSVSVKKTDAPFADGGLADGMYVVNMTVMSKNRKISYFSMHASHQDKGLVAVTADRFSAVNIHIEDADKKQLPSRAKVYAVDAKGEDLKLPAIIRRNGDWVLLVPNEVSVKDAKIVVADDGKELVQMPFKGE